VAGAERAIGGWYCEIRGAEDLYEDILLPVHGRHQTRNLAVAVAAAEALLGRGLEHQAVIDAAAAISCPGRMEVIERRPLLLLDGAHNPEGFRVLSESLDEEFRSVRWVLVVAAMQDKDLETMLPSLAGRIERVIATAIDSPRALAPDDLASKAAALLSVPAEAVPGASAAVGRAREVAGAEGAVLVTGSLYLVGAVRSHLLRGQPAQPNER
jgi:dihydrofolate synthase/folylpolyglutamate synthase